MQTYQTFSGLRTWGALCVSNLCNFLFFWSVLKSLHCYKKQNGHWKKYWKFEIIWLFFELQCFMPSTLPILPYQACNGSTFTNTCTITNKVTSPCTIWKMIKMPLQLSNNHYACHQWKKIQSLVSCKYLASVNYCLHLQAWQRCWNIQFILNFWIIIGFWWLNSW